MLGKAVQPIVERLAGLQSRVHERHHLVHGHAVVGHMQAEERGVAHGARDLVAQGLQLHQAGLERAADLFGRQPDSLSLGQHARMAQNLVDLIGRGGAAALSTGQGLQAEGVAVEHSRLTGLGLDTLADDIGNGAGVLGRG